MASKKTKPKPMPFPPKGGKAGKPGKGKGC
jgi:hypothetical protein